MKLFCVLEPQVFPNILEKPRARKKLSRDTPVFVSIEKCPPVAGTRRMIFTMGTWKPTNLTATLLKYGYYASFCIYYDDWPVKMSIKNRHAKGM